MLRCKECYPHVSDEENKAETKLDSVWGERTKAGIPYGRDSIWDLCDPKVHILYYIMLTPNAILFWESKITDFINVKCPLIRA